MRYVFASSRHIGGRNSSYLNIFMFHLFFIYYILPRENLQGLHLKSASISLLTKPSEICYNKWEIPFIYQERRWLIIQICWKDKEKVYEAIRSGKIDAADMSFPNLIDDILLTMKRRGLTELLSRALPDKRRDNSHIPFGILLCLAVAAKLKCKTSLTDLQLVFWEYSQKTNWS